MNGLLNSQMLVASRPLTRETAKKLLENTASCLNRDA